MKNNLIKYNVNLNANFEEELDFGLSNSVYDTFLEDLTGEKTTFVEKRKTDPVPYSGTYYEREPFEVEAKLKKLMLEQIEKIIEDADIEWPVTLKLGGFEIKFKFMEDKFLWVNSVYLDKDMSVGNWDLRVFAKCKSKYYNIDFTAK